MTQHESTLSWIDVFWSTAIVAAGWALAFSPMWLDRLSPHQGLLTLVVGGLAIGAAQWMVTTRRFGASAGWVLAYGLGWSGGLWCGAEYGFFSPNPFTMGACGGALVGVMQWVTLRHHVSRAALWVPLSIVISLVGCWFGVWLGNVAYGYHGESTGYLIGSTAGGLVMGFLTTVALRWFTKEMDRST